MSLYTDCWLPVKQMMLNIIKTKIKTKLFFLTFKSSFKKKTRFFWMKISNWRRSIRIFGCTQAWPAFSLFLFTACLCHCGVADKTREAWYRRPSLESPSNFPLQTKHNPSSARHVQPLCGRTGVLSALHTTGGTSSHAACLFWWRCHHVIKAESQSELP